MDLAIKEAKKALKKGNIPIGSVIVQNNDVIATAHNQNFWHAEILCIIKAQKKLGKFLPNAILYSTLEPCPMCEHAIKLAKISTVIFGARQIKEINFKIDIIKNIKNQDCSNLLEEYFKNKRKINI